MSYSINQERLIKRFLELTVIDCESFHERKIGERVESELRRIGLAVRTDTTAEDYLEHHPESYPNIYAVLPASDGREQDEPLLLAAHLDTVSPGHGKTAIVHDDGTIASDGKTVLGADDAAGLAIILEALESVVEQRIKHPEIEVLITPAEEAFCEGSGRFHFPLLKSKKAYVFDLDGPVGTAAHAAPSILSFSIEIHGRAAHAGFAPESGINALSIAAKALSILPTGRIDAKTTVNFGTISGGTGINIVPERVTITGEVRSFIHSEAVRRRDEIFDRFEKVAQAHGGDAEFFSREHIRAYRVEKESAAVGHFRKAAKAVGYPVGDLRTTYGGSDANRLNEHGIDALVVACAMENVHTTAERTSKNELARAAVLALALIAE